MMITSTKPMVTGRPRSADAFWTTLKVFVEREKGRISAAQQSRRCKQGDLNPALGEFSFEQVIAEPGP